MLYFSVITLIKTDIKRFSKINDWCQTDWMTMSKVIWSSLSCNNGDTPVLVLRSFWMCDQNAFEWSFDWLQMFLSKSFFFFLSILLTFRTNVYYILKLYLIIWFLHWTIFFAVISSFISFWIFSDSGVLPLSFRRWYLEILLGMKLFHDSGGHFVP